MSAKEQGSANSSDLSLDEEVFYRDRQLPVMRGDMQTGTQLLRRRIVQVS